MFVSVSLGVLVYSFVRVCLTECRVFVCAPYSPLSRSFRTLQAAISLEEDGTNVVSSTLADELLGAPFASMAPRSSGAHVGR